MTYRWAVLALVVGSLAWGGFCWLVSMPTETGALLGIPFGAVCVLATLALTNR